VENVKGVQHVTIGNNSFYFYMESGKINNKRLASISFVVDLEQQF
jgi:hypothetical protein